MFHNYFVFTVATVSVADRHTRSRVRYRHWFLRAHTAYLMHMAKKACSIQKLVGLNGRLYIWMASSDLAPV